MKTPDKIFASSDPFGFMSAYYIENHPPYGEEYIRKDALLEWLNNKVERYNDKLIQPSNNKEEAIQIASSISSLLGVIAKVETL